MIKFSKNEWIPIQQRLIEEHGLAVMTISWVCRRELGFTIRNEKIYGNNKYIHNIYLDFFDDAKETFFTLKYL